MKVKNQLLAIKAVLSTWAQNEGGTVEIAIDHAHMWEFAAIDQDSPRVILCYDGEEPRGDFNVADVTQRVDRRFCALVTRGRGYDVQVGDALAGVDGSPAGQARPFYDLVEEAREKIRFGILDDPCDESPPYFRGIDRVPFDPSVPIYGYLINFTVGTQLPDLVAEVNRPWIPGGDVPLGDGGINNPTPPTPQQYLSIQGPDPVIGPPFPPVGYQLNVSREAPSTQFPNGRTVLSWTVPGLTINVSVIVGAGSGTPPGYAYLTVTNYGDTWVNQSYSSGDKVLYNHLFYQANQDTTAADVPGVSSKWTALSAIVWSVFWKDTINNLTFQQAIPPSSPPYLTGRCWWADASNNPASSPQDRIRLGVKIDDYYADQAATFYFYIAATTGAETLTSQTIAIPVPLPI